jgi:hypothetical protein
LVDVYGKRLSVWRAWCRELKGVEALVDVERQLKGFDSVRVSWLEGGAFDNY